MINVLMICHGNICRSPMAEYVLKDMVRKQHLADRFCIASAATSREEIGTTFTGEPAGNWLKRGSPARRVMPGR